MNSVIKRWRLALIWLLFLAPFFFLTYGQVNQFTATLPNVKGMVFGWESSIPFWPWTIIPYWSIDLFYGLSLFICTSTRELNRHGLRLVTASLLACIGFLLFPLRFTFTRPVSEGLFGWLFQQLELFDLPYNQAPSLHIILLWILWLRFYAHTAQRWRWLLNSWAALIALSVLTTWQHHFIDVVSGLFVGVAITYCLPIERCWHWTKTTDKPSLKLAKRYFALSGLLLIPALYWSGLCWWPVTSIAIVAMGYLGLGVSVFQKNRAGEMSFSARLLLAPYLFGYWLSFLYHSRRTPVINQITPQIYLGSYPCAQFDGDAILDLTSERGKSHFCGDKFYIANPRLDLVAPTVEQLQQSVESLNQLTQHGSVLVHCALGLSRSAIVVAAWLLEQDQAQDVNQSLAIIRQARPQIVITVAHQQILSDWYAKKSIKR